MHHPPLSSPILSVNDVNMFDVNMLMLLNGIFE